MRKISLFLLLAISLSSCNFSKVIKSGDEGSGPAKTRGTESDNPLTTYLSSKFLYSLNYSSILTLLEQQNGEAVTIDNSGSLESGERLSSLRVEGLILENVRTLSDLNHYLITLNSGILWSHYEKGDVKGYYRRIASESSMYEEYYFLTAQYVIHAIVDTYQDAGGFVTILPIIGTFEDRSAPLISNLEVRDEWRVGGKHKIYFQIDDASAISLDSLANGAGNCGTLINVQTRAHTTSCSPLVNEGNNLYSKEFDVSKAKTPIVVTGSYVRRDGTVITNEMAYGDNAIRVPLTSNSSWSGGEVIDLEPGEYFLEYIEAVDTSENTASLRAGIDGFYTTNDFVRLENLSQIDSTTDPNSPNFGWYPRSYTLTNVPVLKITILP